MVSDGDGCAHTLRRWQFRGENHRPPRFISIVCYLTMSFHSATANHDVGSRTKKLNLQINRFNQATTLLLVASTKTCSEDNRQQTWDLAWNNAEVQKTFSRVEKTRDQKNYLDSLCNCNGISPSEAFLRPTTNRAHHPFTSFFCCCTTPATPTSVRRNFTFCAVNYLASLLTYHISDHLLTSQIFIFARQTQCILFPTLHRTTTIAWPLHQNDAHS